MEPAAPLDPVAAFAALAHPQRLAIVRLLMRHYPRRVAAGEIGAVLALKPSTLSGYLAQLMEAGLINQERRATSLLYAASVEGAEALNARWIGEICGGRGHVGRGQPGARVRNVLFIGAGNAGPTLMAEALLRERAGEAVEVFSAGLEAQPGGEAATLEFLAGRGQEVGLLWAKPLSTWTGDDAPAMDVVITLGDRAASRAPDWPGGPHRAAWRLAPDTAPETLSDDLAARIGALADLPFAAGHPRVVQAGLDRLAEPGEAAV
ncbi:helix-turn-helix domain-containing protein [Pararhodobacter marinus]|uniref:helix-turn-helix domain-containing protein n=1 Tax=Pararhodobacter marinus TaxID=2184063 RepID=UPI003511837F